MTTQAWVDKHISFALKQKDTREVILGLQAVCDRLNISPLKSAERRKTVRPKRAVQQPQPEICPDCNGAGKIKCEDQSEWVNATQYYRCPKCCGTGKLSGVR
jgi:hypothetical protein